MKFSVLFMRSDFQVLTDSDISVVESQPSSGSTRWVITYNTPLSYTPTYIAVIGYFRASWQGPHYVDYVKTPDFEYGSCINGSGYAGSSLSNISATGCQLQASRTLTMAYYDTRNFVIIAGDQ